MSISEGPVTSNPLSNDNGYEEIQGVSKPEYDLNDAPPPQLDLTKLFRTKLNIRNELDKITQETGYGLMSSINQLVLSGFNYHRTGQQLVHNNRDNMGFTFFTRPCLNLTYDNLSSDRTLMDLRNAPVDSIGRYIRNMLDPWGARPEEKTKSDSIKWFDTQEALADKNARIRSLVNEANPFIPLLSNTLISLSGWQDISLSDYTSKAGIRNEQWAMADGFYHKTNVYEMNASFRNIEGDPISLLFQTWEKYIIACRENTMQPYQQFIIDRMYDYNTRIYRFIMDHTKTYIQKWAATIAFPLSIPFGNQFNYQEHRNFQEANNELPVTFKCMGADYNDPILFYEFNKLVEMFEPNLKINYSDYDFKTNSVKMVSDVYRKLTASEKLKGTYFAIPIINFMTRELEWWVHNEVYKEYFMEYIPNLTGVPDAKPVTKPKNWDVDTKETMASVPISSSDIAREVLRGFPGTKK